MTSDEFVAALFAHVAHDAAGATHTVDFFDIPRVALSLSSIRRQSAGGGESVE